MLERILCLSAEKIAADQGGKGKDVQEVKQKSWPHRDTSCGIVLHHPLHQVNAVSLQGREDLGDILGQPLRPLVPTLTQRINAALS